MKLLSAGVLAAVTVLTSGPGSAQSVRSLVNGGNEMYSEGKYADAEVRYRKALEKEQQSVIGKYNLGNALHKQGKFDEALKQYESLTVPSGDAATRAEAYYNSGNTYLRQQKFGEAIGSYIESLKLRPDDFDAKYNLSYALQMLKKQQQQQQKKPKDDKKKNQDQQQQQQNQQNKQNKDQQQPQQRPQQQERKIAKADAERILEVLKNNERDVQKKLRARQQVRPRTDKDW